MSGQKSLFQPIGAQVGDATDDTSPQQPVDVMDSLCLKCNATGVTRLLLTSVPYFKELVLAYFECGTCGESNVSVQGASEIQQRGHRWRVECTCDDDLNRQIVRSEYAEISIPELEFIAPPQTASLSTVQGFLVNAADALATLQPERQKADAATAAKIQEVIDKLNRMAEGKEFPFSLVIDDPSGNSFIHSLEAPNLDKRLLRSHYTRTIEQSMQLGLASEAEMTRRRATAVANDALGTETPAYAPPIAVSQMNIPEEDQQRIMTMASGDDVVELGDACPSCAAQGVQRIYTTNIPYFRDIILMSFVCDRCGFKSREVKMGGGVAAKGRRIALRVVSVADLSRDVLKSDTAVVSIPELQLEYTGGSYSGRFTTVEGLLSGIAEDVMKMAMGSGGAAPLTTTVVEGGDSQPPSSAEAMRTFLDRLEELRSGTHLDWYLMLEDPLGHVYVQNPFAPRPDPNMEVEEYERTWEENEELGLNDINTENYEYTEATTTTTTTAAAAAAAANDDNKKE